MFGKNKRRIEDNTPGYRENIIATESRVKGIITGNDTIRVAGNFEGEVKSDGLLIITEEGKVEGTISCQDLIVEGEIQGDVEKARNVEIRESGKVTGNIKCDRIALAEGSFIEGEIHMTGSVKEPSTFVEKRGQEE